MKETEKKQTHFLRIAMMVLTTILIVLFFMIMSMVGKIQGTARVINYAGLVRGGTQRMVKLEISGEPQDKMYETISSYIEGLRYGSDKLNFVRLADKDFQNKMDELAQYFEEELRSELLLVREKGYENTDIISKSEHFFQICDETVSYAEVYSQKKATALDHLEKVVLADILGLVLIIGTELIKAVRFAAQNRILQKKVYLDEATGLPNKNKCEEILNAPDPIPADELVAMCVFDLNNLRTIILAMTKVTNTSVLLQYSFSRLFRRNFLQGVTVVMSLSLSLGDLTTMVFGNVFRISGIMRQNTPAKIRKCRSVMRQVTHCRVISTAVP